MELAILILTAGSAVVEIKCGSIYRYIQSSLTAKSGERRRRLSPLCLTCLPTGTTCCSLQERMEVSGEKSLFTQNRRQPS